MRIGGGMLIPKQRQTGSILLISLMLLIVLTILTFTVTQTALLQEKMTGNDQDVVLAFQVAEAAISEAENQIRGMNLDEFNTNFSKTGDGTTGVAGMYEGSACDGTDAACYINILQDPFDDATWVNSIKTSTVSCGTGVVGCLLEGQYVIVRMGELSVGATPVLELIAITNQYQDQAQDAVADAIRYKIMAMGVGNNPQNRRVIVSYFGQSIPLL
jgi:Tfp pilus assembly protein PilX